MAELGHRRDTPLGVPASSCQKRFHLAKYPAWKLFSVPQFWEQSGKHLNKTWGERLRKALLPSFELGWFDCPRSAKLYVAQPHLRKTGPPLRGNTLHEVSSSGLLVLSAAIFVFREPLPGAGWEMTGRSYESKDSQHRHYRARGSWQDYAGRRHAKAKRDFSRQRSRRRARYGFQ